MKVTTTNLEETHKLAKKFIDKAPRAPRGGAFVVLLEGDLGSGKTSFVQGVARALGITEHVTSPTFVLLKKYQISSTKSQINLKFQKLVHIDAYRLEREGDLEALGFNKIIKDSGSIVLVEWPELVDLKNYPTIHFRFIDDKTREIELPDILSV